MQFPTTRWDELAHATLHGDDAARRALDEFCRRYWTPVNAFIRRKGYAEAEADDLTQDFFLNFIATRSWRRADPVRGRFRTFLLGALAHRLAKAYLHQTRLKRGGDSPPISLEQAAAGEWDGTALPAVPPAETAHFDREWAMRVLAAALAETRADYVAKGKEQLYEKLKVFLTLRHTPPSYETTAGELGLALGAVKTEIHRLRQALRAALRAEISRTVSAPHEIEEELRHLRNVLATPEARDFEPAGETQGGTEGRKG
ncbi:MAG: sigma-70 family RNA polymerase sigma factor [Opitutaceae bacterium]|nr:sigma-70 family RNA polymerase sigma factor [Opitutaceae bacterium]